MDVRNESIGGGLGWLIAMMALFRGNLGDGKYGEANNCLCQIQTQMANLQAQIGEAQYNNISSMLNQTIGLMDQVNNGRFENLNALFNQTMHFEQELKCCEKSICEVDKDVLTNRFESAKEAWKVDQDVLNNRFILSKEIEAQGFANQINNLNQTIQLKDQLCQMQHEQDKCCCETNRNIEKTAYETQMRDLMYKNDTDKQLADLKCGQAAIMAKIEESRLLEENCRLKEKVERLREKDERNYLSGQIACASNKNLGLVNSHWWADRSFNGDTYPNPPYPYGCCNY